MKKYSVFIFLLIFVPLLLSNCSSSPVSKIKPSSRFTLRDFNPLTNWNVISSGKKTSADQKQIFLDYTDAIKSGFLLPSKSQVKEGEFEFEFSLKNEGKSSEKFFYKIYYQNESYKFPECDESDSTKQNPNAWENFYGSWENVKTTFMETPEIPADGKFHKITGSVRIVGNPRDEKIYYSQSNDRWKRNPRVGEYSFMIVVTTSENIRQKVIPEYVQDISLLHEKSFINPYFYFLFGPGKNRDNILSVVSPVTLKVIAIPDPGAGLWIDPDSFKVLQNKNNFCKTCGMDSSLYRTAAFGQFMHYIDASTKMNNIPVVADVLKENYSLLEYNWNAQFFRKDELISITASTTKVPCQTVASDPLNHTITMKNPGTQFGKWEKQNVGIITRHGFTYGKWTVKARLPKLVNRNNLWNGLTNAIWLMTQDSSEWNYRRSCAKEGYLANYYGGKNDKRVSRVSYAEIDFEILKTVANCPSYDFSPAYCYGIPDLKDLRKWNVPLPEEIMSNPGEVQVACTNWDMACSEPRDYNDGCNAIVKDGKVFWTHRWDKSYRALTERTSELDDELFGSQFYYFQIEWQPTFIIWRIGPSKDKLRIVGYQDNTVTSIPNNQMLLIISQEFHNTRWWVGSPYSQENIPFPKNDLIGEIYEVTIE